MNLLSLCEDNQTKVSVWLCCTTRILPADTWVESSFLVGTQIAAKLGGLQHVLFTKIVMTKSAGEKYKTHTNPITEVPPTDPYLSHPEASVCASTSTSTSRPGPELHNRPVPEPGNIIRDLIFILPLPPPLQILRSASTPTDSLPCS